LSARLEALALENKEEHEIAGRVPTDYFSKGSQIEDTETAETVTTVSSQTSEECRQD